jgi:hypothetical protein
LCINVHVNTSAAKLLAYVFVGSGRIPKGALDIYLSVKECYQIHATDFALDMLIRKAENYTVVVLDMEQAGR